MTSDVKNLMVWTLERSYLSTSMKWNKYVEQEKTTNVTQGDMWNNTYGK